jgi:hypothetical protein
MSISSISSNKRIVALCSSLLLFLIFFNYSCLELILWLLSEKISSRVAESTRLILVKDGFGGDLGALVRCADERRKDARI